MTLKEFQKRLGNLELQDTEFTLVVEEMMELLDSADAEDYYGTEGWEHRIFDDR